MPEIYRCFTDVWVVGDIAGFEFFRDLMARMSSATEVVALNDMNGLEHGMLALFLPPPPLPKAARIRAIERARCYHGKSKMQMVLRANVEGYREISRIVQKALDDGPDLLDWNHEHIDEISTEAVLSGSGNVAIRICGPVTNFCRESAGSFAERVFDRQECTMPDYVSLYDDEAIEYYDPDHIEWYLGLGDD